MDFDYAHYMVTEGAKAKGKENPQVCSPSREAYRKLLAEALNMNRTRIIAFKNKPPTPPVDFFSHDIITSSTLRQDKTIKPRRIIPQVCVCVCVYFLMISIHISYILSLSIWLHETLV
jgi:cell division cycle 20, cofactor of APC complex